MYYGIEGGDFGAQSNPFITFPGVTCHSGAPAYTSSGNYNYTLTLPSDWGVYADGGTSSYYWQVTPPANATAGVYRLKNVRNDNGTTSYYYIKVGDSSALVWDDTYANKKAMSSDNFGLSSSNPVVTLPGVTCNAGVYVSGIYNLTLPSDWGVYVDGGSIFYWYVTPPSGATAGIYKLKSYQKGIDTTYYRYIQVGTSTTLVWDADTATYTKKTVS